MNSDSITENSIGRLKTMGSIKDDKFTKKHKKKSKRRKKSDPLVTNISHLLSTSLNLVSPEIKTQTISYASQQNSEAGEKPVKNNDANIHTNSVDIINVINLNDKEATNGESHEMQEILESETTNENEMNSQSKNAFQFMMENRNKVIGRNSPGKEADKSVTSLTTDNKDKLISRKLLFEKWAVAKGNKKRKVEEEREREIYIKQHLQKRAKKLKQLLSIDEKQKCGDRTFVCDSEDSQDISLNQVQDSKEMLKKNEEILNSNSKKDTIEVNKNLAITHRNSLHSFLGISKSEKRKFVEDDDAFESDENKHSTTDNLIKCKMFSPTIFKRTKKANRSTSCSKSLEVDGHKSNEELQSNDLTKLKSREIREKKHRDKKCGYHDNVEELNSNSLKCLSRPISNAKSKKKNVLKNSKLVNIKEKTPDSCIDLIKSNVQNRHRKFSEDEMNHNDLRKARKKKLNKDSIEDEKAKHNKETKSNHNLLKLDISSKSSDVSEKNSCESMRNVKRDFKKSLRNIPRNNKNKIFDDPTDVYLVNSDNISSKCQKEESRDDKAIKIAPIFLQNKIRTKSDSHLEATRKLLTNNISEEKLSDSCVYVDKSDLENGKSKIRKEFNSSKKNKKKHQSSKSKSNKLIKETEYVNEKSRCNTNIKSDANLSNHHKTKYNTRRKSSNKFPEVEEGSSCDSMSLIEINSSNVENECLRRSRRNRKTYYNDSSYVYLLNSDDTTDDEWNKDDSHEDKNIKIAPVFLQKKVKPKIDPVVLEERRKFLMSGIPEALKKSQEKQQQQQSLDDIETNLFPEISHIQQKSMAEDGKDYWNLPKVNVPLVDLDILIPEIGPLRKGVLNKFEEREIGKVSLCSPEKIKNLKSILLEIKKNNPDYPVFKSFRTLKEKFERTKSEEVLERESPSIKKKKGRKQKKESKSEVNIPLESNQDMMWTEKYKANSYEDLIGNYSSTLALKKWLQGWLDVSENKSKVFKRRDSSGSEFDEDSESRDSTSYPRNTFVLTGPHGSGKTMTVYALCNELGINVLELNASSKRTGKRLMQEMQEATQSHQVRKSEALNLDTFFKTANKGHKKAKRTNEPSTKPRKMCLLLVEDIDIVFEQDEGFLSALMQLQTTSKRPIVLVATDISSCNLQKVTAQNPVIKFSPLTPKTMTTWMQILCLLEGCFIKKESLSELLEWNKGDVRRTLLQLQFWVESGGGEFVRTSLNVSDCKTSSREALLGDDVSLLNEEIQDNDSKTVLIHANCISTFLEEDAISLEKLWWNFPYSNTNAVGKHHKANAIVEGDTPTSELADLQKYLDYFDSLSEIDRCHHKSGILENNHLTSKNALLDLKDSTELSEVYSDFNTRIDFLKEWSSSLVLGQINMCKNSENIVLDMGLPNYEKRRWENKQRACKEKYEELVPLSYHIDKKAFTLDYFPCLRTITRSEKERSAKNQKRRNRFFSYFNNLGFSCSESVRKTACNVLDNNLRDYEKR